MILGAWDHTTFGNDDACDWGDDLRSADDLSFIEETLDLVINGGTEYLEAPTASAALAAAEVIARLQGRIGLRNSHTRPIDAWVTAHPIPVATALAQKSHTVIDRILTQPSELLDLWEESDDIDLWKNSLAELKSRIQT
jgi:hypothetical protein